MKTWKLVCLLIAGTFILQFVLLVVIGLIAEDADNSDRDRCSAIGSRVQRETFYEGECYIIINGQPIPLRNLTFDGCDPLQGLPPNKED